MKAQPGTVAGTVLDAGGRPVAGARVYFAHAPGAVADVAALTAADGRFVLAAPHPGRYTVAAQGDVHGLAAAEVTVGPGGSTVTLRFAT